MKKLRSILAILAIFILVAGFSAAEAEDFRAHVAAMSDKLAAEFYLETGFNLDEFLAHFGFERNDFVQNIYRGATDAEITFIFQLLHGEEWLEGLILATLTDLAAATEEFSDEIMAMILDEIFEWAWQEELDWLEISEFAAAADLETRFSLELNSPMTGMIASEISGANLNLFVKNDSENYIFAVFEIIDEQIGDLAALEYAEIAPGGDFVVQLPPDLVDGNIVYFAIVGFDGEQLSSEMGGEFAFRFTHLPLP
ncbi:MAG: hypothetical protein LBE35_10405 [Clostridiales bacterium]|jgi:hypothetical protein|nr:hypothetical protein [Clostridiales bacterium]